MADTRSGDFYIDGGVSGPRRRGKSIDPFEEQVNATRRSAAPAPKPKPVAEPKVEVVQEPIPEPTPEPEPKPRPKRAIEPKPKPARKSRVATTRRSSNSALNSSIDERSSVHHIPSYLIDRAAEQLGVGDANVSKRDVVEAVLALWTNSHERESPLDPCASDVVRAVRADTSHIESLSESVRRVSARVNAMSHDMGELRLGLAYLVSMYMGLEADTVSPEHAEREIMSMRFNSSNAGAIESRMREASASWEEHERSRENRAYNQARNNRMRRSR
jgi:hypothetical protein